MWLLLMVAVSMWLVFGVDVGGGVGVVVDGGGVGDGGGVVGVADVGGVVVGAVVDAVVVVVS